LERESRDFISKLELERMKTVDYLEYKKNLIAQMKNPPSSIGTANNSLGKVAQMLEGRNQNLDKKE
jgi:hypothetical protein